MQPRNIEVFDGLRITTEHIEHLQGSIHSALSDLREIAGLSRVHRGFGVSRLDAHAVQVEPGLAFDSQGRRAVSDEPIRLETPAAIATAGHFVCLVYDQGADAEVEGKPTRIWDSAQVDIRPALPGPNEDVIVLAELRPAGDEGFTVHSPSPPPASDAPGPAEPTPEEGSNSSTSSPRPAARLGVADFAPAAIDPQVIARLASSVRARVATPAEAPSLFSERLAAAEALAGFPILALATDATARVQLTVAVPPTEALAAETAPNASWRLDASGHGQAVAGPDGSISQFGAGHTALSGPAGQGRCSASSFTDSGILRAAVADTPRTNGDALLQTFLGGLALSMRLVPRNGDGFGLDALLEWNGPASEEIAGWMEQRAGNLTWQGRVGWVASGQATDTSAPSSGEG